MANAKFNVNNLAAKLYFSFLIALSLVLAIFIIAVFSYRNENKNHLTQSEASGFFSDCGELAADCANGECQYYSLCDFVSDYKECRVYDCGKNYGVQVTAKDDQIFAKTYEKPVIAGAKEKIDACAGTVKIVSNKCEKNIGKIIAEIATGGNCPPEALVFKQNDQWLAGDFSSLGSSRYLLSTPTCEKISGLKAIGHSGMTIGITGEEK
jgi:hypothetical protein